MFQGSQASLSSIYQNFNTIKSLTGTTNQTPTDMNNNTEIEKTQEEESCPTLESTVALLRQSLSLQEVELVELKERLNNSSQQQQQQQQLEEQRNLLGAEFRASLLELRGEVKELQQDREEMRRGLTAVKEELLLKDQTIENLTKQIEGLQEKTTPKQSETPPVNLNLTTRPQPIPTITNTTTPPTNKKKPKIPTDADIIILIDSNGKFVNEEQLFPGKKVCKVWCPTTDTALELLTEPTLGQPRHIIIHTGTNDLRAQQERVAECVRRVAQKATHTFPLSRITISTILPRRDVHPATIHRVNADIYRGCSPLPNVHLAHHPALNISSLHDHVHLRRDMVGVFARALKDAALGRRQDGATPSKRRLTHTIPPLLPREHRNYTGSPYQHHPPPPPQHSPPSRPARPPSTALIKPTPHGAAQPFPPTPPVQQLSYAQVLQRTGSRNNADLGEITQLLNLICTKLMGQVV